MKKMIYFGVILALTICVSNGFAQDTTKTDSKTQTSSKKNSDSN